MKIWVVGKRGMLSSAFIEYFQQKRTPFVFSSKEEVDITDFTSIKSFCEKHRPTHIINCSAYTQVEAAQTEQQAAYEVNVKGVANLARASNTYGAKLIHFSTDYVFDGSSSIAYREEDAASPLNYYGKTKKEGEDILLATAKDYLLFRISWLFGRGSNHFIYKLRQMFANRPSVSIVSDQRGRLTYCNDLVRAVEEMLSFSGIYHFANKGEVSWYEIAKYVWEKTKPQQCKTILPVTTKEFSGSVIRPLYSVLDTKKIEKILTFPIRHWTKTIDEYLDHANT